MIIMTNARYKKEKAMMYGAIGASSTVGISGAILGTIALVKSSKVKSDVDSFHTDMERRISAEEGMSKQLGRAVSQIQTVLEKNDILRVRS